MGGKAESEQMEEEKMHWCKRYMLHPSSFGVKVLPPDLQPRESPSVKRSLRSRNKGRAEGA